MIESKKTDTIKNKINEEKEQASQNNLDKKFVKNIAKEVDKINKKYKYSQEDYKHLFKKEKK